MTRRAIPRVAWERTIMRATFNPGFGTRLLAVLAFLTGLKMIKQISPTIYTHVLCVRRCAYENIKL